MCSECERRLTCQRASGRLEALELDNSSARVSLLRRGKKSFGNDLSQTLRTLPVLGNLPHNISICVCILCSISVDLKKNITSLIYSLACSSIFMSRGGRRGKYHRPPHPSFIWLFLQSSECLSSFLMKVCVIIQY